MDADLLQKKLDLAKIILFTELLKKEPSKHTKAESELLFWLTSDKTIQEILNRIDPRPAHN